MAPYYSHSTGISLNDRFSGYLKQKSSNDPQNDGRRSYDNDDDNGWNRRERYPRNHWRSSPRRFQPGRFIRNNWRWNRYPARRFSYMPPRYRRFGDYYRRNFDNGFKFFYNRRRITPDRYYQIKQYLDEQLTEYMYEAAKKAQLDF